jgi:membrane protein YqaA with SNARE-associated domain
MSTALVRAAIRLQASTLLLFGQWPWLAGAWKHVVIFARGVFHGLQMLGLPGIFIIAILDSSLLSIPEVNDVLVVKACVENPSAVFYYPLIAASGSVIGCLILFHITRRGGQALLHKRFSKTNVVRVEKFFARYGALCLVIPSLCPPPTPFKIFVATAGALQYPRRRFIISILVGRFTRYTVEGILAAVYGRQVLDYMRAYVRDYPGTVALIITLILLLGYVCYRIVSRYLISRQTESAMAGGD